MNRTEYEAKKAELVAKRNDIEKELDALRDSFSTDELNEYKEKFEGKYVLYYSRELRKTGKGPIIPTEYTIYHIDEVTYVGNGFINVTGHAFHIINDKNDAQLTIRTHDEFRADLHVSTWEEPDAIITHGEFSDKIKAVNDNLSRIMQKYL